MPSTAMSSATVQTRAEVCRRYVELSAIDTLLYRLLSSLLAEHFDVVDWEGLETSEYHLSDSTTRNASDLSEQLWPHAAGDYEATVEWHLAQAECCSLVAAMLQRITSPDGAEALRQAAAQITSCTEESAARGRVLASGAGS